MSNLKLRLMSNVEVFIQVRVVTIVSVPSFKKIARGKRLSRNEALTAVLTVERGHVVGRGRGLRVESSGTVSRAKIINREEAIVRGAECIAAAWSCAKSLWFLRPTDELLSFGSGERAPGSNRGGGS